MALYSDATKMAALAALCEQFGRDCPSEWPEGLRAHGGNMRDWVIGQADAPSSAPKPVEEKPKVDKKQSPKKKSVKKDGQ